MSQYKEYEKRATDPLIKLLIQEVRGFREDMKPIRQFMEQIDSVKKAGIWTLAIFAAIGAAITWVLNVKDHFKSNG